MYKSLILLNIITLSMITQTFANSVDNLVLGKLTLEPGTTLALNALSGRSESEWRGFPTCTPRSNKKSIFYTLPDGFVILETKWIEKSRSSGDYAISTYTKDTKLITLDELTTIRNELINNEFSKSNDKVKIYINNKLDEYEKSLTYVNTNKNTVRLDLRSKAHGSCTDKKRGWIEGTVKVTAVYLGSDISNIKSNLIKEVNYLQKILDAK